MPAPSMGLRGWGRAAWRRRRDKQASGRSITRIPSAFSGSQCHSGIPPMVMPAFHPSRRQVAARGFSLLELLVAVAIVAALLGLLIPAVQRFRLAAARTACRSDLRQIGLALHGHLDVKQAFPFASGRPRPGVIKHQECRHLEGVEFIRPQSWAIGILPYIEEPRIAALYDLYCLACPPEEQDATVVGATVRIFNARSGVAGGLDFAALLGPGPAAPDPAVRLEQWYFPRQPTPGEFTGILVPEGLGWIEGGSTYRCPIAATPVRENNVTDGLSNTLVIAESGDYSTDDGRTWTTPRYSWPYGSDAGRYVGAGAASAAAAVARSLLPRSRRGDGMIEALAGDGSVRSIADTLAPEVFTAVVSRAGGERP